MKKSWQIAKWIGLVVLVVAVYAGYRVIWGHPFTINQLANRQAFYFLLDNPEIFSDVGIGDGGFLDHPSDKLTDVGNAKRDHDYAQLQKFIDEVHEFDRSKLQGQDQITYDVLVDWYGSQVDLKK